jgi:hypothetical protein
MTQISLKWVRSYRMILLDFVNAKSPQLAYKTLVNYWGRFDLVLRKCDSKKLGEEYRKLCRLFEELSEIDCLYDSAQIEYYTQYYEVIRPQLEVLDDNCIGEGKPRVNNNNPFLDDILTLCVVKMLRNPKILPKLYRCANIKCKQFFFSQRLKKKVLGQPRFCCNKCRMDFNNRKRTESGVNASYKRQRKHLGLAPVSYYG